MGVSQESGAGFGERSKDEGRFKNEFGMTLVREKNVRCVYTCVIMVQQVQICLAPTMIQCGEDA